jgi:uncharacterized membrane protein YbhN (UPF0104 family)
MNEELSWEVHPESRFTRISRCGMPGSILSRLRRGAGQHNSPPEAHPPARRWRWGLPAAALLLVCAGLLYLRWGRQFRWRLFFLSFAQLDWRWVAAAAGFALLTYAGRALRWAVMLRPLRPRPNLWGLLSATAIGFTAIVLLGRAGELVRPYLISVRERVPFSSQMAAWLLERILDLLAILLVFGIALAQLGPRRPGLGPGLRLVVRAGGYAAAGAGFALLVMLILFWWFSDRMGRRLLEALGFLPATARERAGRMITAFQAGLGAARSPSSVLWLLFYTALEWALIVLGTLALFRAYSSMPALGVREVIVFMGLASIGSLVQIPGLGGGVQVASVVVLTELYGFSLELATNVAMVIWATTFVVVTPAGLTLALIEGLNWRRIREVGMEAGP